MIELIAGGARSGKSRLGLERAQATGKSCIFIATAQAQDEEFADRIARHKAERGPKWRLSEVPLNLAEALAPWTSSDCVLIDCLTLWVTNWLILNDTTAWQVERAAFLAALEQSQADVILVTNEVGQGVVPMGELSRRFVDESGWLHQDVASLADRVTMVTFGLAQTLKP